MIIIRGDAMKKVPVSNYIKSLILIIITVVLTIFLANNYKARKEYESNINITMSFLTTVDASNIEEYLIENHDVIMYLSNSSDESLKEYEETLKKLIIKKELEKDIIYFDTKDLDEEYLKNLFQSYTSDNLENINIIEPNLLIFDNGKINKILYKDKQILRATDIVYITESILEND